VVKDCIHAVLKEELAGTEYSPEEMPQLTKHLSENIKDKLKGNTVITGDDLLYKHLPFKFLLFNTQF
jgi:hypothetical protein